MQLRSVSVDLNVDPSLQIDIPDALSEKDRVKFTVHTKVRLWSKQVVLINVMQVISVFAINIPMKMGLTVKEI